MDFFLHLKFTYKPLKPNLFSPTGNLQQVQPSRQSDWGSKRYISVQFPPSICVSNTSSVEDLSPDRLSDPYAFPVIKGGCPDKQVVYSDVVFTSKEVVEIHREWTVCNPCIPGECHRNIQILKGYLSARNHPPARVEARSGLDIPSEVTLQVVPNPFSDQTIISFSLPQSGRITLLVTNMSGQVLFEQTDFLSPGIHQVELNKEAIDWPSGMYICSLRTPTRTITQKVMRIR